MATKLVAKNIRSQALANFTRCHNILTPLLADPDNPSIVVTPQYEKLKVLWEKLQGAQDSFIELATDIEMEEFHYARLLGIVKLLEQ